MTGFDNDGKLTKRDARASALAKLAPFAKVGPLGHWQRVWCRVG